MLADLRAGGVVLIETDGDEPLRLAELRAAERLKLPDCCVLDAALTNDATLVTVDEKLAEAARRLGLSVLP